jgi:hypothetical protein
VHSAAENKIKKIFNFQNKFRHHYGRYFVAAQFSVLFHPLMAASNLYLITVAALILLSAKSFVLYCSFVRICLYVVMGCRCTMAPKQRQLDLAFFTPITKEEREKDAKMEFACLNKRLDKERATANEKAVPKRHVGRPKKEKVVELLRPTAMPMKPLSKKTKKVRGHYHNWFTPTLWPPIFKAIKQHRNLQ